MNMRFEDILGTIGRTPVVRLNKLAPAGVRARGIGSSAILTSSGEIAASHVFRGPRAMNWRYASNAIESMFHLALQRGRNRLVE